MEREKIKGKKVYVNEWKNKCKQQNGRKNYKEFKF